MDIATVNIRDNLGDELGRSSTIKDEVVEAVEDDDPRPAPTDRPGGRWNSSTATTSLDATIRGCNQVNRHNRLLDFMCCALANHDICLRHQDGYPAGQMDFTERFPGLLRVGRFNSGVSLSRAKTVDTFAKHDFNTAGCVEVQNMTLLPPPDFRNSISRRWFTLEQNMTLPLATSVQFDAQKTLFLALIRVLYSALGLLVALRHLGGRYHHYRSTISRWLASMGQKITQLRSGMQHGKKLRLSNSDHRYGNHSSATYIISQDDINSHITTPHIGSATEVYGQGTGARFIRTCNNNGSRRRGIFRNRHNYHHSSRKGNHVLRDMDDSSSDELFYPRQSGVGGESKRSSRARLRRRSGGKPAQCDVGVHDLKMA